MSYPLIDLGSVVDLQAGIGFPTRLQGKITGDFPFAKVGDISRNGRTGKPILSTVDNYIDQIDVESLRAKTIPKGSILFAKIGEAIKQNHRVISHQSLLIDNNAMAAIPSEKVDNLYLYYFLKQVDFYRLAPATTVPALRKSDLEKIKIPLPPLAEQRRIASILDQADDLRQKRQQAIEKLDQLLQVTFIEMFGDPVSNPKGWDVKKLENLTTKIGSGSTPKGGDSAYKDEGISLVRSLNIYDGQFSYKNLAFIDQDQADKLKNVILQANDVLLNITGASVARCCLVPNEVLPARVNQHVSILRVKDNLIPEFLEALLISKPMKLHLLKISGAGATREALTKLQLQELEIIVPPLDIQNEFLLKLESIKCLIDLNSKQLNELDKLFISSQNQAFNGSL